MPDSVGARKTLNNKERRLISSGSTFEKRASYSRAVADGPWCFVAGTTGFDYATMVMPPEPAAQTRNTLETISRTLDGAGFSLKDVVRLRIVITDRAFVDAVFEVLGEVFVDIRPAATMTVHDLVDPAMKVEIDATALRHAKNDRVEDIP